MSKAKRATRQLKTTKEYRSLYAKAKKAGLVTDKGKAGSYKPTEYSKRRLRELEPYLNDTFGSVKVTPRIARQYKEVFDEGSGSEIRVIRGRVILPKNSSQYVALRMGLPSIVQPLNNGTFEEIVLPVRWRTIGELERYIEKNPWLDDVMKADGYESYRFAIGEGEPGNRAAPSFMSYQNLAEVVRDLYRYDFIDGTDPQSTDISGFVKLYRERADWRFPEYQKRKKEARSERKTAYQKRYREAKERLLTDEQRTKIREQRARHKREYYERIKFADPDRYIAMLDARNEKRRTDPKLKSSDAERKRKARANPEQRAKEAAKKREARRK